MEHVIQPLGDRVLIQAQAVEETTLESGLVLPGNVNPKETYKSEVVAVGPDVTLVEGGQLVLVTFMAGEGLEHDQQDIRKVAEGDILAVIAR